MAKANPLTAAKPIRNPVKEPGPIDTAIASSSLIVTWDSFKILSTVKSNFSECARFKFSRLSLISSVSSVKAIHKISVAVSMARIFNLFP